MRILFVAAAIAATGAFKAGVIQHSPLNGQTDAETIALNLAAYSTLIETAATGGAQLAVLPEFGLGIDTSACTTPQAPSAFCEPIPYVVGIESPCSLPNASTPIQVNASCAAKQNNVAVAINTCEALPQGNSAGLPAGAYNVELVYEAGTGRLLALYRKTHVWFTSCFLAPTTPELVTFTLPLVPSNSSAGSLRLGIFTCFDILFSTPGPVLADKYGVKHFVYSAAIPLVASAAQELWSAAHGATLFGSNLQTGESGIYVNGTRVTAPPAAGDCVLFADVA